MVSNILKLFSCATLLLAAAQVNAQTAIQDQLSKAIRKADQSTVRSLLDSGASAKARDSNGFTPLVTAVLVGVDRRKTGDALAIAGDLLNAGADINQEGPAGNVPLAVACSQTASAELVKFLIARGADVNRRGYNATTPLYQAVRKQQVAIAEILIEHGADVRAKDNSGATPLHYAALNGMDGTAKLLLARGAEINARDREGKTPIAWAQGDLPHSFIGTAPPSLKMVELLRQRGGIN